MIAKRSKGEVDSQIRFTNHENTGILVQHKFNRAIFYHKGETKDTFEWTDATKLTSFNDWVQSKRALVEEVTKTNTSDITKHLTEILKQYK